MILQVLFVPPPRDLGRCGPESDGMTNGMEFPRSETQPTSRPAAGSQANPFRDPAVSITGRQECNEGNLESPLNFTQKIVNEITQELQGL